MIGDPFGAGGGDAGVAKTLKRLYLIALSHGDALFYQHRINTILQHVHEKRLREWAKYSAKEDPTEYRMAAWARIMSRTPELEAWRGVLDGLSVAPIDENRASVLANGLLGDLEGYIPEVAMNRSRLLTFSALNEFLEECGFYDSASTHVTPTNVRNLWIRISDCSASRREPHIYSFNCEGESGAVFQLNNATNDTIPPRAPRENNTERPTSSLAFLLDGHEEAVFELKTRVEADAIRRRSMRRESIKSLDMSPLKVRRRHEAHQRRRRAKEVVSVIEAAKAPVVTIPRRPLPGVPAWNPTHRLGDGQHNVSDRGEPTEELPFSPRESALFFKKALEKGLREAALIQQEGPGLARNAPPPPVEEELMMDPSEEERISELEFAQLLLMVVLRCSSISDSPEDAWGYCLTNHFEPMYRDAVSPDSLVIVLNLVGTEAPRGLRVCQSVLYDLLRSHMDWLLIPLFRAYLLVDKRQMDCAQWMQLMGDVGLPNIDGPTAHTIFIDANMHDTEGMLTGTVAEALEFDEFLDAMIRLATTEFGSEVMYPTLITSQSQLWELMRWLRRVFGILDAGEKVPSFNYKAVGRLPPLVNTREASSFSVSQDASSPVTSPPQRDLVSSSRHLSHSKAPPFLFGADPTSMSAVLCATSHHFACVAEKQPSASTISFKLFLEGSLKDTSFCTLTPAVRSGSELNARELQRLQRLDGSMCPRRPLNGRLWDAVSCKGFGNGVNLTRVLDRAGAATRGPTLSPRLTMVYPPRLCIDEVSSFLIGGVFLPNLNDLAQRELPHMPIEHDSDDDDLPPPRTTFSVATPRTQPRTIVSSGKSLPVLDCARSVRELVNSHRTDDVFLERLEREGRPTNGGGLLPCPGYNLGTEIKQFRLREKKDAQRRHQEPNVLDSGSLVSATSLSTEMENESDEGDEAERVGTSKSGMCPVSVMLGPIGIEASAIQVDRNRWQVSFDVETIDYGALLPVVEVEERVLRETVSTRERRAPGTKGATTMREPGMMTSVLLEQSTRGAHPGGGSAVFTPLKDTRPSSREKSASHPLGVSWRPGDVAIRVPEPTPSQCVAYTFKTRQSVAWRVALKPKAPNSTMDCGDPQHVVLELTHTKDKLTLYQSQWLRGVFDQFCDPESQLLTAFSFMNHTLPRFRRFPVVLGVPTSLRPMNARRGTLPPSRTHQRRSSSHSGNVERLFSLFVTQEIGSVTQIKMGADNRLEIHHQQPLPPPVHLLSPPLLLPTVSSPKQRLVSILDPQSPDSAKASPSPSSGVAASLAREAGVTFTGFLLFLIYAILGRKAQGGLDQSPTDFVSEIDSMIPRMESESEAWLESLGIDSMLAERRVLSSAPGSSKPPQPSSVLATPSVSVVDSHLVTEDSVGFVKLKGGCPSFSGVTSSSQELNDCVRELRPAPLSAPSPLGGKVGRRGIQKVEERRPPEADESLLEPVVVPQQLSQAKVSMAAYHRALSFRDRSAKSSKSYGDELAARIQASLIQQPTTIPHPPVDRQHPIEPWQRDVPLAATSAKARWNTLFGDHETRVQQVAQASGAHTVRDFFNSSMTPRPPDYLERPEV